MLAVILAAVTVPLTPNDVNVPTLVMFGCAAVVTVPAVVAVAAARLATVVVELTVNGAVPVAILLVNILANITLAPVILPPEPPPTVR